VCIHQNILKWALVQVTEFDEYGQYDDFIIMGERESVYL